MKRFIKYLLLFLFFTAPLSTIWAVTFKGEAPGAVIAGQKFTIKYSIDEDGTDFRFPSTKDVQLLMGPSKSSSSSVTIINGKMERTSTYSYTHIMKCDKPGRYTIAPATIVVNGKKIESNSITFEVIKGEDASKQQQRTNNQQTTGGLSDSDLFIRVVPSKTSVYKDEPVVLTTKLYVKPQVSVQGLSDQKIPDLKGFIVQDLSIITSSNTKRSTDKIMLQ